MNHLNSLKEAISPIWKLNFQIEDLSHRNLEVKLPRGFTLIETLVYLALYAIIIVGSLASVYGMFESSAHNETAAMVEEEGDYLIGKIDWALFVAVSIQLPTNSGNALSVTRSDGRVISIRSVGPNMRIQENASPFQTLNNSNVTISRLQFTRAISVSDGLDPESISVAFTIYATTSDGHVLSRDFSTLQYLRK